MTDVEIKLDRYDRVYYPGDTVSGVVSVKSPSKLSHQGIKLNIEGKVTLQLSARSVGLFEAFYSSIEPLELIKYSIPLSSNGRLPKGCTELPFEFDLKPRKNMKIYETYHGVYVSVQYIITTEIKRGVLTNNIKKSMEFIVKLKSKAFTAEKVEFKITPENLKNVHSKKKTETKSKNIENDSKQETNKTVDGLPDFLITGFFNAGVCNIEEAFGGEIVVKKCEQEIRSVELQFVRVETCIYADTEIREATEVQNIQLADGNICRNLIIPIYMIFPRLFTCVTTMAAQFKIEYEVNVVVLFKDNHMLTENFPLKLVRISSKNNF